MSRWVIILLMGLHLSCMAKPPADRGKSPPEIFLEGVGFKVFRGNEMRAYGISQTATYRRDTSDLTASQGWTKILRPSNQGNIDLTVFQVSGNSRAQSALAQGGVRIVDGSGAIAHTKRAKYEGHEQLASGDDPVELTGENYLVNAANGFILNFSGSNSIMLKGPVVTTVGRNQ